MDLNVSPVSSKKDSTPINNDTQHRGINSIDSDMYRDEKLWYACRTMPRAEKTAALGFQRLGISHYLPLITRIQQWSDRKKAVEFPMFAGYIFVHSDIIPRTNRIRIIQAPKIIGFMQLENKPIIVPAKIINDIRILAMEWQDNFSLEGGNIQNRLKEGDPVVILEGPLRGVEGTLLEIKNKPKIVVYVEAIGQGVSFETNMAFVDKRS